MSEKSNPFTLSASMLFVSILSINVAVCEVILVGRFIMGHNRFEYMISKNLPVGKLYVKFLYLNGFRTHTWIIQKLNL